MAAYQCLNCHKIERSGEDCCATPDLFCINDMPAEIVRLRAALERALRNGLLVSVPDGAVVTMFGGGGGGGCHAASSTKDGGNGG